MYQLRLNDLAPAAIINSSAEPIIATGAIIADIPMVDGIDVNLLRTGDRLVVDADDASVEIIDVPEKHVVTSILKDRSKILLLQRSDRVGSFKGQWAGVSGFIEHGETDDEAVRREMEEEIGSNKLRLLKHAEPQRFRDGEVVWCVHPFLFEVRDPDIRTDWEHKKFEWVAPEDVAKYQTVPGLQQVVSALLCRK
jgi:8-oxo-dGTP pyrophosphatase MutT (NUDIX family)